MLALISLLPSPSFALPAFARKYDLSCTSCHTKPPRLNRFGEAFHMAGFQIPMVPEGEIKGKRRIGRIFSEADFLNIFSTRVQGDFIRSFSESENTTIALPQNIELYLTGSFTDAISYFFEFEHEGSEIEALPNGKFEETSGFGLGKEAFFMFDLSALFGTGHHDTGHGGGRRFPMHGPMVMVGKIDPSTNFSYPTNRQIIPTVPGRVNQEGTIGLFSLSPYAFVSKFFGVKTADGRGIELTQPMLYNTTGDTGIDLHAMVGPMILQAGLMQGSNVEAGNDSPNPDPYLMARINFGGTDYLSGSLSGLGYFGDETVHVPTPVGSNLSAPVNWRRIGVAANIQYYFFDLYGAYIEDKLKLLPNTLAGSFDADASGFTVEGDYLATDRMLLSLRYDFLHAGGLVTEKTDGEVITLQGRYYLRDNFSFYLRDSVNTEGASEKPLQNFKNLIAFGLDFDF